MNKKNISTGIVSNQRALQDSEVDLFFYVNIVKTKSQDLTTEKT